MKNILLSVLLAVFLPFSAIANQETFEDEFSRPHSPTIGYSTKSDGSWTGWNKFWFGMAVGGQTADVITTINAIDSDNCSEANPLLGSDPDNATIIGVKVAVLSLAYFATEYIVDEEYKQSTRNKVYGFLGILGFGAASWNASLDCN